MAILAHNTHNSTSTCTYRPVSISAPYPRQAAPPSTANMTTTTTKYTISAPSSKHETAKNWLQRHLRKAASRQTLKNDEENSTLRRRPSLTRPRTAPSTATARDPFEVPPLPPIPINIERAPSRPSIQAPPRPPRPDPSVIRDVNAWLDASMNTPSPPLMGGLSYWRAATVAGVKDSAVVQHAIPIVRDGEAGRPSITQGQRLKSFRCRTKRMQVQMPSLRRTKSGGKQTERQPASMPLLAVSYEDTQQAAPPKLLIRSRSFLRPATRPSTAHTTTQRKEAPLTAQPSLERLFHRHGTLAGTRVDDADTNMDRRINAMFRPTAGSADSTRPSTAVAGFMREDSMGDLSDAPTYFTGPPPPSYRSRTVSILTTSSFGCIDGMNTAQRLLSQQRAAQRRGMRGKLRKLAQSFKT